MFTRIVTWIKVNLASVIGIAQAAIKALKEVVTAIVNLVSIFMPTFAAQGIVLKIREILNWIDSGLEWIKSKFQLIPVA